MVVHLCSHSVVPRAQFIRDVKAKANTATRWRALGVGPWEIRSATKRAGKKPVSDNQGVKTELRRGPGHGREGSALRKMLELSS